MPVFHPSGTGEVPSHRVNVAVVVLILAFVGAAFCVLVRGLSPRPPLRPPPAAPRWMPLDRLPGFSKKHIAAALKAWNGAGFTTDSPEEARDYLNVLLSPIGDNDEYLTAGEIEALSPIGDHDPLQTAVELGDRSNVPYLIRVLKFCPPPFPDGSVLCSTADCLWALEKITGQRPGNTYEAWAAWWETQRDR